MGFQNDQLQEFRQIHNFSTLLFHPHSGKVGLDPLLNFGHRFFSTFSHFPDRNNGKKFREDHVKENEKRDASSKDGPFDPGGRVDDRFIGNPWIG